MRRYACAGAISVLLLFVCSTVIASSPGVEAVSTGPVVTVGYQGYLTDPLGGPITGVVSMQFRLYSAPTSGTLLWDSGPLSVQVEQGVFSVGLNISQDLFTGRALWLAVSVDGRALSPRQELRAVPYAAGLLPGLQVVGQAEGSTLSAINTGSGSGLRGASARGYGVYGYSDRGAAVYGENTGSQQGVGYGGYFSSNTGVGAYGLSGAMPEGSNPHAPGLHGYSVHGVGVYGTTDAVSGTGVYGQTVRGSGVQGRSVEGPGVVAQSTTGTGLLASSATGTGARVESASGVGLEVKAHGESADAHGVTVSSQGGTAVRVTSASSTGVWAESGDARNVYVPTSKTAIVGRGEDRGVFGGTTMGSGVEGMSDSGAGVRGRSTSGYGGYFVSDWRGLYAANLSGKAYDAWFGGDVGIYVQGTVVAAGVNVSGDIVSSGAKTGYVVEVAVNGGPDALEPGDVVEIVGVSDPVVGEIPVPVVRRVTQAGSTRVLGVADCRFDPLLGRFGEGADACVVAPGEYLGVVTLGAYRVVKADATGGEIAPGDLLVASAIPGHVQRSDDPGPGCLVGKALGALQEGVGLIAVFVGSR